MINFDKLEQKMINDGYKVDIEYPKRPEGYKKEGYVYDENKTVKWNREHQAELAGEYSKKLTEYHKATNNKAAEFREDLKSALSTDYGFNGSQSDIIYNVIWEECHSEGLEYIIHSSKALAEIIKDVIDRGE